MSLTLHLTERGAERELPCPAEGELPEVSLSRLRLATREGRVVLEPRTVSPDIRVNGFPLLGPRTLLVLAEARPGWLPRDEVECGEVRFHLTVALGEAERAAHQAELERRVTDTRAQLGGAAPAAWLNPSGGPTPPALELALRLGACPVAALRWFSWAVAGRLLLGAQGHAHAELLLHAHHLRERELRGDAQPSALEASRGRLRLLDDELPDDPVLRAVRWALDDQVHPALAAFRAGSAGLAQSASDRPALTALLGECIDQHGKPG